MKCKGFGKIDLTLNQFIQTQDHNHEADAYKTRQIAPRNKLKRAAETSSDRLRDVFDDTCRNDPEAIQISYRNTRCIMSKRRKLQIPGMPKSADEFSELLLHSRFSNIHKVTVRVDTNSVGVIFMSNKMASLVKVCKHISFDGTFYIVPKIFYQLFTIFCFYHEHTIPVIHILMTNKSEELYSACLKVVFEIIPDFEPNFAVSDFEDAPRNAFQKQVPGIQITGCLFHYTQAIWNRVRKAGLVNIYRTNFDFIKWLRCIMALPLLPQKEISSTFCLIGDQIIPNLSQSQDSNIRQLKKYIKKQWVLREKNLSVFETPNATNNGAETYYKSLKSKIKTHRPNIWSFLDSLEEILCNFDLEYGRLEQGLQISCPGSKHHKENAMKRRVCREKLTNGTYTPLEYLIDVSSTVGKQSYHATKENDFGDEFHDEISDEDEAGFDNICVVCLQTRQETHVLVPRGHGNLCGSCAIHIMSENKRCPTCRIESTKSIRLFQ